MTVGDAQNYRIDARNSLLHCCALCDDRYNPALMHAAIADHLEQIAKWKIYRQIISAPPQHGKSRLVSIEWPTWLLGRDPTKKIISTSYGQDLANRNSKAARDRLDSDVYRALFPHTRLDRGSSAIGQWYTTEGGYYKAAGVGGPVTGQSADVLIIDDPVKDFSEAMSQTVRDNIWDWFTSVAMTRLAPDGSVVIIMTRWHVDDLVGRLLDPKYTRRMQESGQPEWQWNVLNLPALAEADDPLGRSPGDALYPERYNKAYLHGVEATQGAWLFGAQYQGKPTAKGGNYVDTSKIEVIKPEDVPSGMTWVRYWDLGATRKQDAVKSDPDSTASPKVAFGPDGTLYIADMLCGQWAWPKARSMIIQAAISEGVRVGVEVVGGFNAAFDNLLESFPKHIPISAHSENRDKFVRAWSWFPLVEQRKVKLVQGPWVMGFIQELDAFPRGKHDDQIDGVSGAVNNMLTQAVPVLI